MVDKAILANNVADLQGRLARGLVMYKGKPYWVNDVIKFDDIRLVEPKTVQTNNPKIIKVNYHDVNFDIEPPKIGYMNYGGQALFLYRKPTRTKQYCMHDRSIFYGHNGNRATNAMMQCQAFEDMILGVYPTLQMALRDTVPPKLGEFREGGYSWKIAFSRLLCVLHEEGKHYLEARGHTIGEHVRENTFRIYDESSMYSYQRAFTAGGIEAIGPR